MSVNFSLFCLLSDMVHLPMLNSSMVLATDITTSVSSITFHLSPVRKTTCFLLTALLLEAIIHNEYTPLDRLHCIKQYLDIQSLD